VDRGRCAESDGTGIGFEAAVLADKDGPGGLAEQRGYPKVVESSAQSHDEELQLEL
jgi:hypothetical protein